jgi:RNA polymerase sigma-70 factor (ECF subfamily)
LDLVSRVKLRSIAEVGEYFHRYEQVDDWRLGLGVVENRPAILVYDPREASPQPAFFMLIEWDGAQVSGIRDYRYARYVLRDAAIVEL